VSGNWWNLRLSPLGSWKNWWISREEAPGRDDGDEKGMRDSGWEGRK